MSRTIDQTIVQEGRWEELSDDELRYLHDRDQVPHEVLQERGIAIYPGRDFDLAKALQDIPNLGVVNTSGRDEPEPLTDDELKPRKVNLTKPQLRGEDDDEEDEEDFEDTDEDVVEVPEDNDYESWNQDQRRAELADRGLSVEGRKSELITRLREDDERRLTEQA